jgi:hypothetical protein
MGKKISYLRQSAGEVEIKCPSTAEPKSTLRLRIIVQTIIFIPIFSLFFKFDSDVKNFVFPPFEQLSITSGTIGFTLPFRVYKGKDFYLLYLEDGGKKQGFDNGLNYSKEQVNQYRGKKGKAWWYHTGASRFYGREFLQLEVKGHIVIDYQQSKKQYLLRKNKHPSDPIICLIFFLFVLLIDISAYFLATRKTAYKVSKLKPKK